jgi:hypothetical protein
MTPVLDGVKLGLKSTSDRSFAKRPPPVTVGAVPMTMARIPKSSSTGLWPSSIGKKHTVSWAPDEVNVSSPVRKQRRGQPWPRRL